MSLPIVKLHTIKRKNRRTAFQIDYVLNGKRIRKIIAHDKKSAEIIKSKIQTDLVLGVHGISAFENRIISLKDLIENYLSTKRDTVRESTFKRYQNYFTIFERFMYNYFKDACENIRDIKYIYLQECFSLLKKEKVTRSKPWHPTTINILRDLLIEMFNTAIRDKYLNDNPASLTKSLGAPQTDTLEFFTKEQLSQIFKNLESDWVPLFRFLAFTGLRKNEALSLTWKNVSLDENNPYIRITTTEKFRPKAGKTNTIRLTSQALEILKSQQGKNETYIFPSSKGGKIRAARPNEELKKALDKIGITGRVHMFRHTFASHFLMDGVGNLNDLTNYLSKSDLETTKIYTHLSRDYQADLVKKLEQTQNSFDEKNAKETNQENGHLDN